MEAEYRPTSLSRMPGATYRYAAEAALRDMDCPNQNGGGTGAQLRVRLSRNCLTGHKAMLQIGTVTYWVERLEVK